MFLLKIEQFKYNLIADVCEVVRFVTLVTLKMQYCDWLKTALLCKQAIWANPRFNMTSHIICMKWLPSPPFPNILSKH